MVKAAATSRVSTLDRDTGRRWLALSYGYALLVAAGLGYFLLRIPIQLTDSFANLVALEQPFGDIIWGGSDDRAYFRHGLWLALKIVYELADGNYFPWFRLTHALQALTLIVLFVRLVQPRTAAAAAAVPLGLAVLIGHHTFASTVREAYPINTFMTILVCCAAAANLVFDRHRRWTDAGAVALFLVAASTVESGLLVWVIVVAGYMLGLRGVSRRGVVAVSACLAAYFVIRFSAGVTLPGLSAREAGFGFQRYNGEQLQAMFGANPYGFYAYNVASSVVGVLFGEPRDGVWRLVRGVVHDQLNARTTFTVVSTTLATALLGRFVWKRKRDWMTMTFDRRDQLVLLFAAVVAANAAISYAYTKDVIMSPAGFFFAAAVCAAASDLLDRLWHGHVRLAPVVWVFVAVCSSAWALRAVGIHAALSATALTVREQWVHFDDWAGRRGVSLDAREQALRDQLHDDAVIRYPAKPPLEDRWIVLFDVD